MVALVGAVDCLPYAENRVLLPLADEFFEYHVLRLQQEQFVEDGSESVIRQLDRLGDSGWEVVGFSSEQGRGDSYLVLLKKAS